MGVPFHKRELKALSQTHDSGLERIAKYDERKNSPEGENHIIDAYVCKDHYLEKIKEGKEIKKEVKEELNLMVQAIEDYKWRNSQNGNIGIIKASGRWLRDESDEYKKEKLTHLEGLEIESVVIQMGGRVYVVTRCDHGKGLGVRNQIQESLIERLCPKNEEGERDWNKLARTCKDFGEKFDSCKDESLSEEGYVVYVDLEENLKELCPPVYED